MNLSKNLIDLVMLEYSESGFDAALQIVENLINDPQVLDEDKLTLETTLAISLLRDNESEESYQRYYKIFDSYYQNSVNTNFLIDFSSPALECSKAFFIHNATSLAHGDALLNHIKAVEQPEDIVILAFQSTPEYVERAREIGVRLILLPGANFTEKLSSLVVLAKQVPYLIWVCFPAFLSLVSKVVSNIVWWSLKFHPAITGPAKYITGFSGTRGGGIINGVEWIRYNGSSFVKWRGPKTDIPELKGKKKFGSFCRETLIDTDEYWGFVGLLLERFPDLYYSYCGKEMIHEKWISQYRIDPSRIIFLGWIKPVQRYIYNYEFLLDPFTMSHGHLGLEAMSSGIPVLTPVRNVFRSNPSGFVSSILTLSQEDLIISDPFGGSLRWLDLCFYQSEDLLSKAEKMRDPKMRVSIGKACQTWADRVPKFDAAAFNF